MAEEIIHQQSPVVVPRDDGKHIEEHFGRVSSATTELSAARMVAPPGWSEPEQTPEFDEYVLVNRGTLAITAGDREFHVSAGESARVPRGVRVRYANPFDVAAEYWSLCYPAFAPELAHVESEGS
jgi:probable rRNA maturation factor